MKNKFITSAVLIISIIVLSLSSALLIACSNQENYNWNLSDTVTAKFTDNGRYGFILTVEGRGAMPDYATKKDAPWYRKSGRITDIIVKDGVTSVGKNAFTDCKVKYAVLEQGVTLVGENAFNEETKICAYSQVSTADSSVVYTYSETKPAISGNYWHYLGTEVNIWPAESTKVLFIGNSFTYYNDIPALFGQIANTAGADVVVDSVTQGSWTLTKFADATDDYGKIVDEKLRAANDYDVVVLQDQSTRPLDNYAGFLSGARALKDKISETQTNCTIYLYATWGYADEAAVRKVTIPQMELQLRTAYENAAQELGVKVSYVGSAFSMVYNAHKDVNDNYFAHPENYANSAEKPYYLYHLDDNKHPSYMGSFLSACVHVATILDINPVHSTFTGELDPAVAAAIKEIAYNSVHGI